MTSVTDFVWRKDSGIKTSAAQTPSAQPLFARGAQPKALAEPTSAQPQPRELFDQAHARDAQAAGGFGLVAACGGQDCMIRP